MLDSNNSLKKKEYSIETYDSIKENVYFWGNQRKFVLVRRGSFGISIYLYTTERKVMINKGGVDLTFRENMPKSDYWKIRLYDYRTEELAVKEVDLNKVVEDYEAGFFPMYFKFAEYRNNPKNVINIEVKDNQGTMKTFVLNIDSGKYNEAKFKKLKQGNWYIEGNASVFDEKQKKDPYVYDTAYYSVFEGQMAKGAQKDFYGYSDISAFTVSKESKTEDGVSSSSGKFDLLSGTLNIHEGALLKATASGRILHGDFDVGEGTNGDGYLKANAELYSANLRASTLGDSLYAEIATKTYLKADVASYITAKKSEFGFDFGASADEVSAEAGFQLGHYFVKDENGNRVRKSLFKTEAEPKATAGGSLTLKATEEQAYDSVLGNQDWDVRVLNLKAGGSLELGINFDISIPYIWPDGWFK